MPTQEEVVQALGNMSVVELIDLTKTLEEKWGVKAAPFVGPVPTVVAVEPAPAPVEARDEWSVVLLDVGPNKIAVIKVVREVLGLALLDGKTLVEKPCPTVLKEDLSKTMAEELRTRIEAAGGKAELK